MASISRKCANKVLQSLKCHQYVSRSSFHLYPKFTHRYTTEELYKGTGNTVYEDFEPGVGRNEGFRVPSKKEWKETMKNLSIEFDRWVAERKEHFMYDPVLDVHHGQVYRVFSFGRTEDPATWTTLTDADEGYGYSTCEFTTSANGCAVFRGELSTQVVPDGMTFRSGFAAIRAPKPTKSFKRKSYYEWGPHTHLVLRVRGDGRTYALLLGASGHFDTTWYNAHAYPLYTRGGPYWQISKIPFTKFFLTHKGYIQDKQWEPQTAAISSFGISLMDDVDGPFHLEIDYIGLETNILHEEIHAYEMYKHENALGDC